MPHVIVKLWPGKSEQQKNRLVEVGYGSTKSLDTACERQSQQKEISYARRYALWSARSALRGARHAEDHQTNRRDHQEHGDVRLRIRPLAIPRYRSGSSAHSNGTRVLRDRGGSR